MLSQGAGAAESERATTHSAADTSKGESGKAAKKEAKKEAGKDAAAARNRPLTESEIAEMVKMKLAEIRKARAIRIAENRARASLAPGMADFSPSPKEERHAAHWSYEGENGPLQWGKLNPAWAKCGSGMRQSPIDIRDGIQVDLEQVKFDYQPSHFNVVDNGHTVQVNLDAGNSITLTGRKYELVQFHFHRPSEEKVNGRGFEMVAHLVHKDAEGRLAVVAVLIDSGTPHNAIQTVWNNLPLEKNEPMVPVTTLDLNQLLPQRHEYYTYMGSLTTPPCSEGVLWLVMKEPIQASPQQLGIFARLYPMNARPTQASSGRLIKESN